MQNLNKIYNKKLNSFLDLNSFFTDSLVKKKLFIDIINIIHKIHFNCSEEFKLVMKKFNSIKIDKIENIPFLIARLFKEIDIKSVEKKDIFKILSSSGTSGKQSKIFLSKNNAINQTKVLSKIFYDFFGNFSRFPMIIVDSDNILKNRISFSARAAAVLGFSVFGKDHFYLLDQNYNVKENELSIFLEKYKNNKVFIFGFTSLIWEKLILFNFKKKVDLKNSFILHGGGWKKLAKKNISNSKFKKELLKKFNIKNVHNYYGMIEQGGSIFFECSEGNFHTSVFSEILIRDKKFKLVEKKQKGIIQSISILPISYPGHSILTEDEGMVIGEDNCTCGKKGKIFKVFGRLEYAETRGCSDNYDLQ